MPKVSIIIPCYNQGKFLDETLKSVYEQTYKDWECLMIDDGSTDNTPEICKSWLEKDSRFKYFHKKNEGVNNARNFGLDLASGTWIQLLDADDLIKKEKLSKSLLYIDQYNLIITDFEMLKDLETMDPFCNLQKYEINYENFLAGWDVDFNLPIHCPIVHSLIIDETRFKTSLKAKDDWIFWLEIFRKHNLKIHFIPERLAIYRSNDEGASKNFRSVYLDQIEANQYVYEHADERSREILFRKLNKMLFAVNNTNLDQKNYIRKLQNTKILKAYLSFRKLFQ